MVINCSMRMILYIMLTLYRYTACNEIKDLLLHLSYRAYRARYCIASSLYCVMHGERNLLFSRKYHIELTRRNDLSHYFNY